MLAHGVAWWSGSEGNYWGHNAIIRVEAFAQHAGLPRLTGPKPFGGHIMSHDFVEAALLRRAGWRVHMASTLSGSYEESPPTLAALLARDRRWSQGNLQHLQVLCARGLHWISRFHLLRGISAYVVAPLWLLLLASAAILPLRPEWGVRPGAPPHRLVGASAFDLAMVGVVFAISVSFLLAPKVLAYVRMLRRPEDAGCFGGPGLAAVNVAVETVLSTLVAPLIMVSHTRSLAAALSGRDSGWAAQARDETGPNLRQTMRLHAADTALGLALVMAAESTQAVLWMAPVIAGLAFSIPLAMAVAGAGIGRVARRAGILLVPEEIRPPQILARANALSAGWPAPARRNRR
jgi:membrane glycosyltransferase